MGVGEWGFVAEGCDARVFVYEVVDKRDAVVGERAAGDGATVERRWEEGGGGGGGREGGRVWVWVGAFAGGVAFEGIRFIESGGEEGGIVGGVCCCW